ncbi:MAG: RluA family pseudouridine synthase [Oculatellaceae cyanobacterium Prado106]|nr:RluA family pseudouridine synthase [Oculatellaceae cyanobacterium Prado106]
MMNQGWIYREQVDRTQAGFTLLDYYSQRYRHSTRAEWCDRILTQQVQINDQPATPETILQPGQWLTYHRPPWDEPSVPLDIQVLYEDADLLVVAKPAGLPVLPGGGFLEHTLLHQLQKQYPQETPVPIHRLGRGTSGLMLLARSPLARSRLTKQMRDRQIRKIYRALVGTGNIPDLFTIAQPIGKIPHPVLGHLYAATPDGQFAQSDVQVLQRRSESTLLSVTIHTGRPHQIRIHLASFGYPLIGDPLYAIGGIPHEIHDSSSDSIAVPGDCGYHLHAYHLEFVHPREGSAIAITCPPPTILSETYPIN